MVAETVQMKCLGQGLGFSAVYVSCWDRLQTLWHLHISCNPMWVSQASPYYLHFPDEEEEAQMFGNWTMITEQAKI